MRPRRGCRRVSCPASPDHALRARHERLHGRPDEQSRVIDADSRPIYLNTALLNAGSYFEFDESVSSDEAQSTWEFQVGGYQVLHKWLYNRRPQKDAPGRTLSDDDLRHYQRVVVALRITQRLMRDVDTDNHCARRLPAAGQCASDSNGQTPPTTAKEMT